MSKSAVFSLVRQVIKYPNRLQVKVGVGYVRLRIHFTCLILHHEILFDQPQYQAMLGKRILCLDIFLDDLNNFQGKQQLFQYAQTLGLFPYLFFFQYIQWGTAYVYIKRFQPHELWSRC